jgi:hypothetical protein
MWGCQLWTISNKQCRLAARSSRTANINFHQNWSNSSAIMIQHKSSLRCLSRKQRMKFIAHNTRAQFLCTNSVRNISGSDECLANCRLPCKVSDAIVQLSGNWNVRTVSIKIQIIKFHENEFSCSRVLSYEGTNRESWVCKGKHLCTFSFQEYDDECWFISATLTRNTNGVLKHVCFTLLLMHTVIILYRIWDSHSGSYECCHLLGYSAL